MHDCQRLLVLFDCGCIGFRPLSNGSTIIVKACDGEDAGTIGLFEREVTDKQFQEIEVREEIALFEKMAELIIAGHRFNTIKSLLR